MNPIKQTKTKKLVEKSIFREKNYVLGKAIKHTLRSKIIKMSYEAKADKLNFVQT